MTNIRMTPAQARAVQHLAPDGSWTTDVPGKLTQALSSASFQQLVEGEWGDFGPRGGRKLRWRLTSRGAEARQQMEPRDV